MANPDRAIADDGFAVRIAVFYGGVCATIGIQMPFFPVYLAAKGLDAGTIGVILATPMLLRILAVPLAAQAADRSGALRGILIGLTGLAGFWFIAVAFADAVSAILVAFSLAVMSAAPLMPLADAYALRGFGARAGRYGSVRLWGSAAFITGNLGAGLFVAALAPANVVWLIVATYGATVAAGFALRPLAGEPRTGDASKPSPRVLFGMPALMAVIAAASFVQGSHAAYYGFSALDWRALGFGSVPIGALWAIGVAVEIVLFALAGRLPAAFTPTVLIMIGAGGACLRWLAMTFDPPLAALVPLQMLHALSFAATYLGTVLFVANAAPPGLGATAQGLLATAVAIVMAGATALAGALYGATASRAYAAMTVLALAGLACGVLAHRLAQRTKAVADLTLPP